ncbi:MAG: hypothetical protein PVI66_16910 [Candidatus Aminicenantes bacterium]|jgi:hypothetical protein
MTLFGYEHCPIQRHFYTDIEKYADNSFWQLDFPFPTQEETIAFLGPPPKIEDLPDWMKMKDHEKNTEKLRGFHSQIPHELLCDPDVPHAAVRLYAVYHKFCKVKDLSKKPTTFVGRKTIRKHMGVSEVYIWKLTKLLERKGWVDIEVRKGKSNIITLYGIPKKR